ncbi:MAG: hypothetical protein PV344_02025 [Anaplasma sp.]|nr:hypothetical protein [Anaplasma sp.]
MTALERKRERERERDDVMKGARTNLSLPFRLALSRPRRRVL